MLSVRAIALLTAATLATSASAPLLQAQSPDSVRASGKSKKPKDEQKGDKSGEKSGEKKAGKRTPSDSTEKSEKKPPKLSPLFTSETPLAVTFTTNIKQLRKDRGAKAPYHAATLSYTDSTGKVVTVDARARTRGIWRLKNCEFPPVRMKVADKAGKQTVFNNIAEPKLVTYCRNSDVYDNYILQEFMLYRIYRLLTPVSHHVRLLKMTYADSATGKVEATRYSFVVEDPATLAERVGGEVVRQTGADSDDLDAPQSAIAFVFQYMIGNTDFSFGGLHNAELIRTRTGQILPIAYDFDFSGAVNTHYAAPDPKLRIRSVRERQFRGYCAYKLEYQKVIDLFIAKKPEIYALYADPLGQLLSPRIIKETLSYFDDFYKSIPNAKEAQKRVFDECVGTN